MQVGIKKENNLAGCVVLYNPDAGVYSNINKYIDHLDHLFIIDNSEIDNKVLSERLSHFDHISYIVNEENIGIAAALNKACNMALEKGYSWILTMDQDSFINSPDFFNIAHDLRAIPDLAIVAASCYSHYYNPNFFKFSDDFLEVGMVITSGNILNITAWKQVGGFCEKLFIDEVDNEFCARLRLNGFKIVTSKKNFLSHSLGATIQAYNKLRNKQIELAMHSPMRFYYITRNNMLLWKKYFFSDNAFVRNRVKFWLIRVSHIIRYYPEKSIYLKYIYKGLCDSFMNRFGKYKST